MLLAAGSSTRMGSAKQLLPFKGKSILAGVLKETLCSELDTVVLVLGSGAGEIEKALGTNLVHPKLKVVRNPRYPEGMSTSIAAGLSCVDSTHDHVMILLADMPLIHADVINLLIEKYLASGLPLGALSVRGKRVHPVIFSRKFYADLYALKGDVGGRRLFREYEDSVCLVESPRPGVDRDVDTPEDYADFRSAYGEGAEECPRKPS